MRANGNLIVTLTAPPAPLPQAVTAEFDSQLQQIWRNQVSIPGFNQSAAADMAVDSTGDVIVSGGANFTSGERAFVVRYRRDGSLVWLRTITPSVGSTFEVALRVRPDQAGNTIVNVAGLPSNEAKIVKLDVNGDAKWTQHFPHRRSTAMRIGVTGLISLFGLSMDLQNPGLTGTELSSTGESARNFLLIPKLGEGPYDYQPNDIQPFASLGQNVPTLQVVSEGPYLDRAGSFRITRVHE